MAFLDDVKAVLRVKTTDSGIVGEISGLIAAAKADLALSGIIAAKATDDTDALVSTAIKAYCKAYFGLDNPERDKLIAIYEGLKATLSLTMAYAYFAITFTVKEGEIAVSGAEITFNNETKQTNSSGVAIFEGVKAGYDQEYTVTADGYVMQEGELDVSASASVAIALVGE